MTDWTTSTWAMALTKLADLVFADATTFIVCVGALAVFVIIVRKFFCATRFPMTFKAKVVWVCDGDSVYVRKTFGRKLKLRLLGMDAPESEQSFGQESTDYLKSLIDGRRVTVCAVDRDIYGRYVSRVTVGDTDVSLAMIDAGLAWPYFHYFKNLPVEDQLVYKTAYEFARRNRRGLWQENHPQPPWQWRKERRTMWSRFCYWLRRLLRCLGG
ncbi:MAG: thermonuclease family protein [Sutterellaceae bacterium]|nr:thermonuclease family protein [Sutterellaceae bacterium]